MIDRDAFLGRAAQQLWQLRIVAVTAALLAIVLPLAMRELAPQVPHHDILRGLAMAFGLLSGLVAAATALYLLGWRRNFERALRAMPEYDHNPQAFWALYGYLARPLWRGRSHATAAARRIPH